MRKKLARLSKDRGDHGKRSASQQPESMSIDLNKLRASDNLKHESVGRNPNDPQNVVVQTAFSMPVVDEDFIKERKSKYSFERRRFTSGKQALIEQ